MADTQVAFRRPHGVLESPELVSSIFSFQDMETTAARCISVCKCWFDPAANVIWKDLKLLEHLMRLLYTFDGQPVLAEFSAKSVDWTRFDLYAKHVRSLSISPLDNDWISRPVRLPRKKSIPRSDRGAGCLSKFQKMVQSRLKLSLFPSLRDLHLDLPENDMSHILPMLLQPGLTSLTLTLPMPKRLRHSEPDFDLFPILAKKSVSLKKLFLDISAHHKIVEAWKDKFVSFLCTHLSLEEVLVPANWFSLEVVPYLSQLPNLRDLRADGSDKHPVVFQHGLNLADFLSLKSLSILADLTNTARIFDSPISPTQLTKITVKSSWLESATTFSSCLNVLVNSCFQLEELVFQLHYLPGRENANTVPKLISYEEIKSVLSFPKLVNLTIAQYRPFRISDDNIDELARNWPSVKVLRLRDLHYNRDATLPKVTFASLASLLVHCPELEELELPFNQFHDKKSLPSHHTRFPNLFNLTLGLTSNSGIPWLVVSLQRMLLPLCQVRSTTSSFYQVEDELFETWRLMQRHSDELAQVGRERDAAVCQRDALSSEVQALTSQVQKLRDELAGRPGNI